MKLRPRIRWLRYLPVAAFLAAGLAGAILPYDPRDYDDAAGKNLAPTVQHLLGTDHLGRDLLERLVMGTSGFFLPGLLAAGIALVLGTSLGALAGYVPQTSGVGALRGWKRLGLELARGVVGVLLAVPAALPRFVSILLICSVFDFHPLLLGAAIGVLYAAELGSDVRRRVSLCCGEEYVEAARADGLPALRIVGYHILWLHCRALILRHLLYVWSFCILVETSLCYLGEFGIPAPNPSWGNVLADELDALLLGHVWASLLATAAIVATVAMLARAGDRLADVDTLEEEEAPT